VSDAPLPTVGSADAGVVDETIQREWDRFAMPDHSFDPSAHGAPLAPDAGGSANATVETGAFESLQAYGSSTALDGDFTRAELTNLDDEDTDDSGALR